MAEPSQNREDIIKIDGELRLIHQKLDNHITHMSAKIDTIFKIVWTVSFMVLGLILKAIYKKIVIISIIGFLIFGFFSLYNS